MARWTLLGSIGVAVAPVIVTASIALGYGWRVLYLALAVGAAIYVAFLWRERFDAHAGATEESIALRQLARNLFDALRNAKLLRWVILTEFADLMLDKLLEVTGLYFHDVVGVTFAEASGAVALFAFAGLVGDALLIPILERVNGIRLLRVTTFAVLALYVAFLLIPFAWLKFALIGAIALCTSGWFAILHGRTYAALPGQSGLVVAISSLSNVLGLFVPLIVGGIADVFGLSWAMCLLALGPIALIIGLPRGR